MKEHQKARYKHETKQHLPQSNHSTTNHSSSDVFGNIATSSRGWGKIMNGQMRWCGEIFLLIKGLAALPTSVSHALIRYGWTGNLSEFSQTVSVPDSTCWIGQITLDRSWLGPTVRDTLQKLGPTMLRKGRPSARWVRAFKARVGSLFQKHIWHMGWSDLNILTAI